MQTQIKSKPKATIPVFIIAGDPEPTTDFIAGECVCKTCRSKDLTYYCYLDDAKCDSCSQWQNEDSILD